VCVTVALVCANASKTSGKMETRSSGNSTSDHKLHVNSHWNKLGVSMLLSPVIGGDMPEHYRYCLAVIVVMITFHHTIFCRELLYNNR
jgi:hypothetical protein